MGRPAASETGRSLLDAGGLCGPSVVCRSVTTTATGRKVPVFPIYPDPWHVEGVNEWVGYEEKS